MRYYILLFTILLIFSCGNEKVLELPEISHSEITEINDVSAAYLFYDETKKDSVELNRKNLISTTNWLINVDKRLTLKQVIPHIKFLQEKKLSSSHKNKTSKNYFTCNDTSIKNLGFIEFTDIEFTEKRDFINYSKTSSLKNLKNQISINFNSAEVIRILNPKTKEFSIKISKNSLFKHLKKIDSLENIIYLDFSDSLLFEDYIKYKSIILNTNLELAQISNQEFIYN